MMGAFGGQKLTNKGRTLLAKAQTGATLNFTRMAIGDGSLNGQSILTLNALVNQLHSLPLGKCKVSASGNATVGTVLRNSNLTTGFYFREIGLFATDPDLGEILYCYANSGTTADYIPAGGGADGVDKYIDLVTTVSNAASVTAIIDSSLSFLSYTEFGEHQEAAVLDHPDGSVTTAKIANGAVTPAKLSFDPATQAELDAKFATSGGHTHDGSTGNGPKITSSGLANGAATDTVIGSRTITDTSDSGNTGTITTLLSNLANRIKAVLASLTNHTSSASGAHAASAISLSSSKFTSTDVKAGMEELFTSASNGKTSIAAAITGKGISALGSETFAALAAKISQIITLAQGSADATASAGDILINKTAYAGVKVTGTMPDRGAPTITPGTVDQALSPGRYTGGTVKGDANLIAGNILNNVPVFGVVGTLQPGYSASGTAYVSSSYGTFYEAGSSAGNWRYIEVTGLSFKPKAIVIVLDGDTSNVNTNYFEGIDYDQSSGVCPIHIAGNGTIGREFALTGSAYVTNGGFRLPMKSGNAGQACTWIAFG